MMSGNSGTGVASDSMRTEILRYRLERQNAAQSYNGDMAKWILASLIVVNGAPFLLASKDLPELAVPLATEAWHFTTAISLAIVCGFCAWLNTGMREAVAGYDVEHLIDELSVGTQPKRSLTERACRSLVNVGYVAAVITGFLSLGLFLWGSCVLANDYASVKKGQGSVETVQAHSR